MSNWRTCLPATITSMWAESIKAHRFAVAGGTEGELEFSYPTDAGDLPLDFDPRGKFIDILSAGQVVISGLFPSTPSAN